MCESPHKRYRNSQYLTFFNLQTATKPSQTALKTLNESFAILPNIACKMNAFIGISAGFFERESLEWEKSTTFATTFSIVCDETGNFTVNDTRGGWSLSVAH